MRDTSTQVALTHYTLELLCPAMKSFQSAQAPHDDKSQLGKRRTCEGSNTRDDFREPGSQGGLACGGRPARPAPRRREPAGAWACVRGLTLYPPASFVTGLPGLEVVGVALAAPVQELAAALRVPVVVKAGDPGPAGSYLRGQQAGLRVVSYSRGRRMSQGDGRTEVSPVSREGEASRRVRSPLLQRGKVQRTWGKRAERAPSPPGREEGSPPRAGGSPKRGYLGGPEQHRPAQSPPAARAEATARGRTSGPWCPGSSSPPGEGSPAGADRGRVRGCSLQAAWPGCRRWVSAFCRVSESPFDPDGAGRVGAELGGRGG